MLIQIEEICVRFGGLVALNQVNMEVKKGEILGLIGPNGAGKTTLFNCINGLQNPTEGSVKFQDHDITGNKPYQIARKGVARTFQNIQLFSTMTAIENLTVARFCQMKTGLIGDFLGLSNNRREMNEAREKAMGILGFLALQGVAEQRVEGLPFGIKRMVELGRALMLNPQVILLDEPASGMNTSESESLSKLIRRLRDEMGITIFLIEHDLSLVMKLCDRIVVLNFGEKIAEGTPIEVQKNQEVIKAYLGAEVYAC